MTSSEDENKTTPFVRDISAAQFEAAVLSPSHELPVVVDFWAPWCGPCKQLGPVLEKVIGATRGAIQLVKIDIDKEPELATAVGVQSIPTVFAFYKGQVVDGFGGARPESDVKKFVNNLLKISGVTALDGPEEVEIEGWLSQANKAFAADEVGRAAATFSKVLQLEPNHVEAATGLIRSLIRGGDYEEAKTFAENLNEDLKKDAAIETALKALYLALEAQDVTDAEIEKLRKKAGKKKKDLDACYDLAKILFVQNEAGEAIDLLLDILSIDKDWNKGAARVQLLEFFDVLGDSHPLTAYGRRALSSVLFA